jgi:phosphoribosylaminoimidazole-succinocarboxamide synthase
MACRRLDMIPVECVARGYLTGSALPEYQRAGTVWGIRLPAGLGDGSRLPRPVFTPATKAPPGEHDENIPVAAVAGLVGAGVAAEVERITLEVYRRGAELAGRHGIIVADTKIELGFGPGGHLFLADEVLTPDSSRFWPADQWAPGRRQPSLDKQYVRDWLTSPQSGWDRHGSEPPPPLPEPVVERTRDRYVRAYESITGLRWR